MPTAAATTRELVRYRCEQFPNLKVRVASEKMEEVELIHYAEFRSGALDLDTADPLYADTVAALERAMRGGTPIALIGDPADDEDILSKLRCMECGMVSRNEKAAEAHRGLHLRQRQVAASMPAPREA